MSERRGLRGTLGSLKIFSGVKKSIKIKKIEMLLVCKKRGIKVYQLVLKAINQANSSENVNGTIQRERVCDGASGSQS